MTELGNNSGGLSLTVISVHGIPKIKGLPLADDSQDDSQAGERLRTVADDYGFMTLTCGLGRKLMDGGGRQPRGLQNRLRASTDVQPSSHSSTDGRRRHG